MAITSELLGKLGGGAKTKVMDFRGESLRTRTEILSPAELSEDSIVVINLKYRGDNTAPEVWLDGVEVGRLGWKKDFMAGESAYAAWLKAGSSLAIRSFNGSGGGAYVVNATLYITYAPIDPSLLA